MPKHCGRSPEEAFASGAWVARESSPNAFYATGGEGVEEIIETEAATEVAPPAKPLSQVPVAPRFVAVRATRSTTFDAPLIYDIVIGEKCYLVAFALAEYVDGQAVISARNEPLWKPLKAMVGKRLLYPLACTNAQELLAILHSLDSYDSGTCFLVSCDDLAAIAEVVRQIDPLQLGSCRKH